MSQSVATLHSLLALLNQANLEYSSSPCDLFRPPLGPCQDILSNNCRRCRSHLQPSNHFFTLLQSLDHLLQEVGSGVSSISGEFAQAQAAEVRAVATTSASCPSTKGSPPDQTRWLINPATHLFQDVGHHPSRGLGPREDAAAGHQAVGAGCSHLCTQRWQPGSGGGGSWAAAAAECCHCSNPRLRCTASTNHLAPQCWPAHCGQPAGGRPPPRHCRRRCRRPQ